MAPPGDDDSASLATVVTVEDKTALVILGLTVVISMLSVVVVELTVVVAQGVVDRRLLHLSDAQHDRDVFTLSSGNSLSPASRPRTRIVLPKHNQYLTIINI